MKLKISIKNKNILRNVIILFLIAYCFTANCQTWAPVGSGCNQSVCSLAEYNGELYAGGYMNIAGGVAVDKIAKWNGTSWANAGTGLNVNPPFAVFAQIVFDSNLYVAGACTATSGYAGPFIYKWNGISWDSVGNGLFSYHCGSYISSLAVYNSELYAGGVFTDASGVPVQNIAKWNGTNWDSLGSGINGRVIALLPYHGDLYAGGTFSIAGGKSVRGIAKWNGFVWDSVSVGLWFSDSIGSFNGEADAFAVYNDELFVGGFFTSAGGVPTRSIAKWDGFVWDSVSSVDDGVAGMGQINSLAVCDSNLYAGGSFYYAGGVLVKNIAKWNGSSWSALESGIDDPVLSLATYNGDLYAGGDFYDAGAISALHIARWTLSNDIKEASDSYNVYTFPNPATNFIDVETDLKEYSISVFDNMGKLILKEKVYQSSKQIDISNFSTGLYFIQLRSNDKMISKKFIKE